MLWSMTLGVGMGVGMGVGTGVVWPDFVHVNSSPARAMLFGNLGSEGRSGGGSGFLVPYMVYFGGGVATRTFVHQHSSGLCSNCLFAKNSFFRGLALAFCLRGDFGWGTRSLDDFHRQRTATALSTGGNFVPELSSPGASVAGGAADSGSSEAVGRAVDG